LHRRADVPADVEDIDGAMLEEAMASVGVKVFPCVETNERRLVHDSSEPLKVVPRSGSSIQ